MLFVSFLLVIDIIFASCSAAKKPNKGNKGSSPPGPYPLGMRGSQWYPEVAELDIGVQGLIVQHEPEPRRENPTMFCFNTVHVLGEYESYFRF